MKTPTFYIYETNEAGTMGRRRGPFPAWIVLIEIALLSLGAFRFYDRVRSVEMRPFAETYSEAILLVLINLVGGCSITLLPAEAGFGVFLATAFLNAAIVLNVTFWIFVARK